MSSLFLNLFPPLLFVVNYFYIKPDTMAQPLASNAITARTQDHNFRATQANPPQKAEPAPKVVIGPTPILQQKKVPRRSSKPIINWFQRKLTGTGKGKRVDAQVAQAVVESGRGKGRGAIPSRAPGRVASPPLHPSSNRPSGRLDAISVARRKTISLNGDDAVGDYPNSEPHDDGSSADGSSLARVSTWSPGSALEADEDASLRPIPPSIPPSPSPSHSSSSYLSDPRTFRSMAASTKPTTLLSIDMNGNGMAHIAQAPLTPSSQFNRFTSHARTSSSATSPGFLGTGGVVTFSALPQSSSRPSSLLQPGNVNTLSPPAAGGGHLSPIQAPQHTSHHPRNNPRPSSPPLDNASVLTLASSAFGILGTRGAVNLPGSSSVSPSGLGAGDSISHFGGSITYADAESTSQFVLGDEERLEERDFDASVRALRPRSSRRGSWESEASRWSARIQAGPGTPSLVRDRSLWTTNSVRTGALSADNVEGFEQVADEAEEGDTRDEVEGVSQYEDAQGDPTIYVEADQKLSASPTAKSNEENYRESKVSSEENTPPAIVAVEGGPGKLSPKNRAGLQRNS